MAKIDIITLTGLTATDGSLIASGATVKFSSEFGIGTTAIMVRPKVFRTRELFEAGYASINTSEIPKEILINLPEEEYYVLTPAALYEIVKDELNVMAGEIIFEVVVIP